MFIQLLDTSNTHCIVNTGNICNVREHSDTTVSISFTSGSSYIYKVSYATLLVALKKCSSFCDTVFKDEDAK